MLGSIRFANPPAGGFPHRSQFCFTSGSGKTTIIGRVAMHPCRESFARQWAWVRKLLANRDRSANHPLRH